MNANSTNGEIFIVFYLTSSNNPPGETVTETLEIYSQWTWTEIYK